MAFTSNFTPDVLAPTRSEVDSTPGALVLEFGTEWCGFCRGAQALIKQTLADFPQVTHVKIEDGPGRQLGRSFKVKLWPTLVLLKDGVVHKQLVRPTKPSELADALREISAPQN